MSAIAYLASRLRGTGTPLLIAAALIAALVGIGGDARTVESRDIEMTPAYFGVDIRVHQFNMCDVACAAETLGNPRDLVLWFNNDTGAFGAPWSISLNETCFSNANWLRQQTGKLLQFTTTKQVTACPSTDDRFGNAVLTGAGPIVSGSARAWQFGSQDPSSCTVSYSTECRRMVCATMSSSGAGHLTACSTHLQSGNTTIATQQANEYIYIANSNYTNSGKWLAGDFNLVPLSIPSVYYNQYYRSPQSLTHPASGPVRQYDYVWHDQAYSASNTPGSAHCNADYSDHCYAFAKFA